MGKTNNRAAGKWYANREVVPGKRDKQANILPVAERVFEAAQRQQQVEFAEVRTSEEAYNYRQLAEASVRSLA